MTGDATADVTGEAAEITLPGCCNACKGLRRLTSFLRIIHGRNTIFSGVGICVGGPICDLMCAGEATGEADLGVRSEQGERANTDSVWDMVESDSACSAVDVFTNSPFLK